MRSISPLLFAFSIPLAVGCASFPAPTERMASSEAAIRGAREVGAETVPPASLELKLAEEGLAQAKKLMADGDNEAASRILQRAQADAELALALTRENRAQSEAAQVAAQVAQLRGQTK